ncbi:hypothetical protein EV426DRAFT_681950 [Tirmania nivea]|nr:hypothetical protein EV426DRAFT_681950 [Tirmania nivea]
MPQRTKVRTPDPCQLPTPKNTPRVELPVITKRKRRTSKGSSSERRAREQEGESSEDEVGVGPWVGKGNPIGFHDSEVEELIDGWVREQRAEKFKSMDLWEWKTLALYLLGHMVSLVGGERAPEGTQLDGSVEFEGRDNLSNMQCGQRERRVTSGVDVQGKRAGSRSASAVYLTELGNAQDRETELEREIGIITDQVKSISTRGDAEKELVETKKTQASTVAYDEARERETDFLVEGAESKWKQWAEKEVQVKAGKVVAAELQTEVEIEKKGTGDSEDVGMADRSSMYESLSGYQDEDEAPVVAPPTTRNRLHHVRQQELKVIGVRGIMGARWLLGGNRRFGKATSSIVVFFDRKVAVGSHLKMRGRWLSIEAYDFDRGRKRVDVHSDR